MQYNYCVNNTYIGIRNLFYQYNIKINLAISCSPNFDTLSISLKKNAYYDIYTYPKRKRVNYLVLGCSLKIHVPENVIRKLEKMGS